MSLLRGLCSPCRILIPSQILQGLSQRAEPFPAKSKCVTIFYKWFISWHQCLWLKSQIVIQINPLLQNPGIPSTESRSLDFIVGLSQHPEPNEFVSKLCATIEQSEQNKASLWKVKDKMLQPGTAKSDMSWYEDKKRHYDIRRSFRSDEAALEHVPDIERPVPTQFILKSKAERDHSGCGKMPQLSC